MQSILRRVKGRHPQLLRRQSTSLSLAEPTRAPLFQRVPPWWARWTYALIACDVFLTGSAIELTWNNWSTLVDDLEKISKTNNANTGSPPVAGNYVPRPVWQRAGLCIAHLGIGVGVVVALLVTQSRFIRTLAVLPPVTRPNHSAGSDNRRVLIQCAHNWKNNGSIFPINRCSLEEGRDETEMILRVQGERGHWYLGLEDAVINGQKSSISHAQKAVLGEWGKAKRIGHWTAMPNVDRRWKSGPIVRKSR